MRHTMSFLAPDGWALLDSSLAKVDAERFYLSARRMGVETKVSIPFLPVFIRGITCKRMNLSRNSTQVYAETLRFAHTSGYRS